MAPAPAPAASSDDPVGPHPSYIEIAKPYILQSSISKCLSDLNMSESKEDAVRLQGVSWIDQVRRSLQLPVRTFNTAVVYYHKFRLLHSDNEYNWADAAAAALFTACKIEDTLKKSREILCANWNLKVAGGGAGAGEYASPDDARFESHARVVVGLERLMLESAGFDFRNRYPQKLVVKMCKATGMGRTEGGMAWNICSDLYKTFAPLKQSTTTIAVACVELSRRLSGAGAGEEGVEGVVDEGVLKYRRWNTTRAEVMETLLDLLDLYTHHRTSTAIGPLYSLETFIDIRIGLNNEASTANIPRYALYASEKSSQTTNGATPKPRNGIDPTSPLTPATPGTISPGTQPTSAIGIRGQNGTVRFMLDAARARNEKAEVDKYHKTEEEEYEVEVPNERDREREKEREPDRRRERDDTPTSVDSHDSRGSAYSLRSRGRGRGRGRRRGSDRTGRGGDGEGGRGRGRWDTGARETGTWIRGVRGALTRGRNLVWTRPRDEDNQHQTRESPDQREEDNQVPARGKLTRGTHLVWRRAN